MFTDQNKNMITNTIAEVPLGRVFLLLSACPFYRGENIKSKLNFTFKKMCCFQMKASSSTLLKFEGNQAS